MRQFAARLWASLLTLSLLLSLAACGGKDTTVATTMYLRRTNGTVSVSDGGGKELPPMNNLSLYSGYGVGTQPASYAWIDLDDVKLAKLDQNSEISIEKEGRALNIELKSGSLFFNVTQPLEDGETMNIRTSTMLVGIRGTCGWVSCRGGLTAVYILEGSVECSAEGQTVQVNAGEYAELTADGELVVESFTAEDIPAFVRDELEPDDMDEIPVPEPSETPEPSEPPAASDTPEPSESSEPSESPEPSESTEPLESPEPSESSEPSGGPAGEVIASGEAGEGVTWDLYSDGVLTISGTGHMDDYGSLAFNGAPWYEYRDEIETIIIENGITGIGIFAFYGCPELSSVTIPDSVTSIGGGAFQSCTSLTSVTIPDSVTSIDSMAFANCSNLTSVAIPDSVTSIESGTFGECTSLTGVTIPDSVTTIAAQAFWGCTGLTSVTIPDSVTTIGEGAFDYCTSLTDIYYGGSANQWEQIFSDEYYDEPLTNVTVHYSSTEN